MQPAPDEQPRLGRVPDFFVVGHAKSGTTALYAMLSQHPQLFLGIKEPRYFATELHFRDRPGDTPKTLADYKAWFAAAAPDQLVGDVSPDYLWSEHAPRLIAEAQPQARIVAILREPASFLHSLHRQWLRHYVETESDFRKAIELEQPRREGREIPPDTYWPKGLFYTEHARYLQQLRRYHELFGRERVLVLVYDDYRRDNEATVRSVLRFLQVDEHVPIHARESNESVQVQAPRLHGLLRKLTIAEQPAFRAANRSLKAITPKGLRQHALSTVRKRVVFGEPAAPDERFMAELRSRFKPEVVALGEYLDRDLAGLWGYDDVEG
jgi:Sulfotransferase family